MKPFLNQDFILENETAKYLYHEVAAHCKIIDYHNHLSAKEIYLDHHYETLSEVWLAGDHYKWRQLRTNGINEEFITGSASAYEKMQAYATTLPFLIGNPLYHWSHLELQRYFNISEVLNEESMDRIYQHCNELLQKKEYGARGLLKMMNVTHLCTTDDPIDSLNYHKALQEENFEIKVLPTFRPDQAIHLEKNTFKEYINNLSLLTKIDIITFEDLISALTNRLDFFISAGCVISDHGLEEFHYEKATEQEVDLVLNKALHKETLTQQELSKYKGMLLLRLGKIYASRNIVMQLHMGALRNNSIRRFKTLGADTGFDSINDSNIAQPLSNLLNDLDQYDECPKIILYSLNPNHNEVIATMCGNFQDGKTPGKIQFGSGWWFNDQKNGMERQLEALMQLGMVSQFVGMLTDSRSFLSFPRHEYFRRILCNKIGALVEQGEYPNDKMMLKEIIEKICYKNALEYFNF